MAVGADDCSNELSNMVSEEIKNLSDYTNDFPEIARGLNAVPLSTLQGERIIIRDAADYKFYYNGEEKQSLVVVFTAVDSDEEAFTYVNNPYVIQTLKKAQAKGAFPCYAAFDKVATKAGRTCWVVN